MKSYKQKLIFVPLCLLSLALLSWDYFGNKNVSPNDQTPDYAAVEELLNSETAGFYGETNPGAINQLPAAEDVLVKKIPGDNSHLLIMAYYSKDRYRLPSFTINIGAATLTFTDDGKNFDEKAGDGLYTARMLANVKAFKADAIQRAQAMKLSGQKPFRFINRSMVVQPTIPDFNVQRFDKLNAISIADLDNSISNKLVDSLRSNSIFITDLNVVEDPARTWNPCTQTGNLDGAWTFKTIFQQLASTSPSNIATDQQLSDFVKRWLSTFTRHRIINGDTVLARRKLNQLLLNPWLQKSEEAGNPQGFLDMRFAPFKLTSIVNRFDLRERFTGVAAGESRFTFCLIDPNCTTSLPFTFVVEFGIPKQEICDSLHDWATQWYNLKDYELGSPEYNQALQDITDSFTKCGQAPNKPNQSCLNTVRTDDRAFSPTPITSEFREFRLNRNSHQLLPSTVANVPADKYNAQVQNPDVELMVKYINERRDSIKMDLYSVPRTYDGQYFLAGAAHILDNPMGDPRVTSVFHWDGTRERHTSTFIRNTQTRHVFSLNTCTACHSGEFQTNFFHVEPVFFGNEAGLSGFLTGKAQAGGFDADLNPDNDSLMVVDPALRPSENPTIRMFNDILRRAKDLKQVATEPCGSVFQVRNRLMQGTTSAVH